MRLVIAVSGPRQLTPVAIANRPRRARGSARPSAAAAALRTRAWAPGCRLVQDRRVRAGRGDQDQQQPEHHGPQRGPIGPEARPLVPAQRRPRHRQVALRPAAPDRHGPPLAVHGRGQRSPEPPEPPAPARPGEPGREPRRAARDRAPTGTGAGRTVVRRLSSYAVGNRNASRSSSSHHGAAYRRRGTRRNACFGHVSTSFSRLRG